MGLRKQALGLIEVNVSIVTGINFPYRTKSGGLHIIQIVPFLEYWFNCRQRRQNVREYCWITI